MKIPNKESDEVEFKLLLNNAVIVALVAFSNARGGTVYIGVTDNAKAVGVSLGQETLPQFLNEVKNKTTPSIIPDAEIIDISAGKKVVVLSVQEYPIKPVSFQGKYYKSSSDSIVKIFNDKIEFYNPGRLPDSISIEDLLANNYRSTPRNKKIAALFKDMGLIEKYGSGIKRIMGYFKEENLPPPDFRNISDGFMVTVFCVKGTEKDLRNDLEDEETVEKTVEKILAIITENPQVTQQELADITGLTRRGVEWNLAKLKAKSLIERVGPDKGGYWKVIKYTQP